MLELVVQWASVLHENVVVKTFPETIQ